MEDGLDYLGAFNLKSLTTAVTPPYSQPHPAVKPPLNVAITPLAPSPVAAAIKAAGKTAVKKSPMSAANAQKMASAGKAAVALSKRLKGKLASHGGKLAAHGNRMIQRAQQAMSTGGSSMGVMVRGGGVGPGGGYHGGEGGYGTSAGPGSGTTTSSSSAPPSNDGEDMQTIAMMNAITGVTNTANGMQAVLDILSKGGTIADALKAQQSYQQSQMGGLDFLGDHVADLVSTGNDITSRVAALIEGFNPDSPDPSTTSKVSAIYKDAQTWSSLLVQAYKESPTAVSTGTGTGTPSPPGAPAIQSIVDATLGTPNSGAPGDQVTITGSNLTGTTAVSFSGVPTQFNVVSATQLTAMVPMNAMSGMVTVTNPSGTGTSPAPFTITQAAPAPGSGGGGFSGGGGGGGGSFDSGGDAGDTSGLDSYGADDGSDQGDAGDQVPSDASDGGDAGDDSGDDTSGDDEESGDEDTGDQVGGGGGHGGGGHGGHHGGGGRGFRGGGFGWGGPWYDGPW